MDAILGRFCSLVFSQHHPPRTSLRYYPSLTKIPHEYVLTVNIRLPNFFILLLQILKQLDKF
jgi:hypothetical protein